MRSVYYKITRFPSIEETRKMSDELRGKKEPLTIEVTLTPRDGGAEFIIDVEVEMMSTFDHRAGIARGDTMPSGKTSRGGRNSWKWETTTHVYGQTRFPGFKNGEEDVTIDLEFHVSEKHGKLEAKIDEAA